MATEPGKPITRDPFFQVFFVLAVLVCCAVAGMVADAALDLAAAP